MNPFQPSQPSERDLLKALLPPLLEDFQYWFTRSLKLLENENLTFLSAAQQADLLNRVKFAHQEVITAQMMFAATNGEVGVATSTLIPWHRLLGECWQISQKWRQVQSIVPEGQAYRQRNC
jgi:hypothetical protein